MQFSGQEISKPQGISCIQTLRTAVLDGSQKPLVSDDTSVSAKPHSAEGGLRDINDLLIIECAHEFTFVTICLFSMLANRQKLEVFERTQGLKIPDVLTFAQQGKPSGRGASLLQWS